MSQSILISVVIPAFNRAEQLSLAIDSVRSRFPDRVEIVVCDDASTEKFLIADGVNSAGIALRVVQLDRNSGAGLARAEAAKHARGGVLAFLDSDDVFDESWIDRLISALEPIDNVTIGGKLIFMFGDCEGGRFRMLIRETISRIPVSLQPFIIRALITITNPFPTPTVAMSKGLFQAHPTLRHCEDYYTIAHAIFGACTFIRIPEIACSFGHPLGRDGGLSSNYRAMLVGEFQARTSLLLRVRQTPIVIFAVPAGHCYQITRCVFKFLSSQLRRIYLCLR